MPDMRVFMNNLIFSAVFVCALAVPAVAQEQKAADTDAAAIVADCNARKFETRVEIEKDGEKRLTKMKLCAVKDADDASWVRTLEDAKAKIAAHPDISDESKAKIAAEIDAEIAKLQGGQAASVSKPVELPAPVVMDKPVVTATLPPRTPAKPQLTIRCLDSGETGEGSPCTFLQGGTRLAIRADGDLAGSTKLRFLRRGDARGEVTLAGLRQGQTIRSKLPEQLCVGVSNSKVEIQVVSSNQVVETLGPYKLFC
jgi:hypothetical protein